MENKTLTSHSPQFLKDAPAGAELSFWQKEINKAYIKKLYINMTKCKCNSEYAAQHPEEVRSLNSHPGQCPKELEVRIHKEYEARMKLNPPKVDRPHRYNRQ